MLDNLVFMDEAWVHLSGYINGQNVRIWIAANLHALHKNPLHSQTLVFCVQGLNNELRNPCSLKIQLLQKIFQIFTLNLLLCSKGSLVSAICGKAICGKAICGKANTVKITTAFLLDFFTDCIVRCGRWPP